MIKPSGVHSKHRPRGLSILHEDRDVLVIEKSSGLLTMGTDRDKSHTAHSILNDYVRKGNARSRNRVYIVHRLDRETSGVLVFARNEPAKRRLQDNWQNTEKRYLAIVHGRVVPPEGTISSYLAENSALVVYSTSNTAKGKPAHTAYRTLKEANGFSLLEIELLTGRKHQIRVHLSEKGNPVAGDLKYGKKDDRSSRLALHAHAIAFSHPCTGERLTFKTKPPEFFSRLIGNFSPYAPGMERMLTGRQ
jgi:tRNA pseudouridine32 synthase/23S rRNA pseudouridine746 synthase/23S rRNA pseudouridine1911/1915/1917 synthase